ncbi:hypothetical protein ACFOWU_09425 [Epilithonimonas zeae]|uniref:Initiator Rep protein domain-containing protein n=1 Tax=Epilithonimonas zeae TaxID=1416779 RepID=A0A1N6GP54_9FLAO|nr:hypothetical protein [Epilithonimonas zeae]SIO09330.1 hypothetical protein SAMN05444409_1966 [Epilithonimonas zeae]
MLEKNLRLVKREFDNENNHDRIRIGNQFVDDFIFENQIAADIPINALRVIFNIISIISSEQFRPEDRPHQLSLFDKEFETENNTFALMKIRNSKISPSGSTKQVVEAYEFLAKFKMGWYSAENSIGKEIKTFGGLIVAPSYDIRGYTSFLISSYWLKKLVVIPEYNYILYHLVYNVKNNKHIIFAIWLAKIPITGTMAKLATLNRKFGLNYKSSNDFCFKFLKLVRINLNRFGSLSFNFKYNKDSITIIPYETKKIAKESLGVNANENLEITYRLNYFRKRYHIEQQEFTQFSYQYRNIPQTRELIEKSYRHFIKRNRLKRLASNLFIGQDFLKEIQSIIIEFYKSTRMGILLPNGYPVII